MVGDAGIRLDEEVWDGCEDVEDEVGVVAHGVEDEVGVWGGEGEERGGEVEGGEVEDPHVGALGVAGVGGAEAQAGCLECWRLGSLGILPGLTVS